MATLPSSPAAPLVAGPAVVAPRVVFFGPPLAGKSSLLKAFVRAATAGPGSDATEDPPDGPDAAIRRELIPRVIRVDSPTGGPDAGPVVLCDCDGQAAEELLTSPDVLVRGAARGALAAAVRSADALVLVVDATAPPGEIDRTFEDFGRFLAGLEEGRTFGREVGGLPVFLTLTKCDLLHRPGESPAEWLDRVADREEVIRARFERDFGDAQLARDDPAPFEEDEDDRADRVAAAFLPFGSIDLHPAATATQVPDGPGFDRLADPDGSYGVRALAGAVLPAAGAYRARVAAARRRLRWTLTGVGLALGTMLLGLAVLLVAGPAGTGDRLADRVRAYQAQDPPAAVRLADKNFARSRREVEAFRAAPGFDRLPDDLRAFVAGRVAEFDAYKEYRDRFRPPRLGPAEVETRDQADRLAADLAGPLAPPAEYAEAWGETEAARLWRKWKVDLDLVLEAEGRLNDWVRGLVRRGNQLLLTEAPPDYGWRGQVGALFADADRPPAKPDQEIEGSPAVPVLRGRPVRYATGWGFERVEQARRDWADTRDRLRHLRDLSDALGLTAGPGAPPAALDLPEPLPDLAGSKTLAVTRLADLRKAFPAPAYPTPDYPEWGVNNFPDPVRQALDTRLRSVFDTGARHVRRVAAAAVGPGPESAARWRQAADALARDDGVKAWGRLLRLLRRWADPTVTAADPVEELAEFVRRDRFDLTAKAFTLTVPDDLLDQRPVPAGPLVVTVAPPGGGPAEAAYRPDGGGRRDRGETTYTFVPDGHSGTMTYRPGDGLTATLPLRSGGQDYRLVWSAGRSAVYQTDGLFQPPVMEKVGPVPGPTRAQGVTLTAAPPGGLPPTPVLFPDLRPGR